MSGDQDSGDQDNACVPASRSAAGCRKQRGKLTLALMVTTALIAVAMPCPPARAQSQPAPSGAAMASFDIPPQPLSQALVQFSRTTGIQLFFNANLTRGINSPGVQGSLSPDAALSQLLSGSGLSYRFTNATTVAISGPGVNASAPAAGDGEMQLDTITVTGGRVAPADAPFATPGSVSHISGETIERFRGQSAGDMFRGTPGVTSAM